MVGNVSAFSGNNYANDLMLQQYLASQGGMPATNVAGTAVTNPTSAITMTGQPSTDTFEKSSSNNNGLILGALATGGATYAGYKMANPFEKENVFKKGFISQANTEALAKEKTILYDNEVLKYSKTYGINDKETLDAVRKFLSGGKLNKAEASKIKAIPAFKTATGRISKKNVEAAIEKINKVLEKNSDKINKNVTTGLNAIDLNKIQEQLTTNKQAKELLTGLDKKATVADVEKLIKENPKAFGITATEEAEIAKAAKKLAKAPKTMLASLTPLIENGEKAVTSKTELLNKNILNVFDKDKKCFTKDATEEMGKVLKNFKWKQAGKWGAIAAGVAIAFNWAFGGKKES
ncbi:MAG: hypothetical protein LKG27_08570 [Clostridiaceae bacterium]|nr:hypothetical protein [Clostridiaceae bacterium]